jgi:hypothetical protein
MRGIHPPRPCTFLHACNCKHLMEQGYTLTDASVMLGVNIGSLSHVMRGRRHPGSFPIPPM